MPKKIAAASITAAIPMQTREQAVADLTSITAQVVHLCYYLAGSAALGPDRQKLFASLARLGLQVMVRLEASWTPMVNGSLPSTPQLRQSKQLGEAAATALRTAAANATDANIVGAASQASTHIDVVDTQVDLVT